MCRSCDNATASHGTAASRRYFLKYAGAAAASLAVPANAFAKKAPPKPHNILSAEGALDRLMQGNARYVDGVAKRHDFRHEREALSKGQNPYAGILSCADSRIVPEYAFDSGRGDLFVCRVAGNFLNDDMVASFEYAVQVLHTPLLMVLGHQACGAVDAALKSVKDGTTLPGHLPALVTAIRPAVEAALHEPGNTLDNAIRQNVILNVAKLKGATPIIDKFVAEKKVHVVGALYHLGTGRVELLS
jgi:carbonic anhydrase